MKILRTIDSFQPDLEGPAHQAWQISSRLEQKGIHSPILTTVQRPEDSTVQKEQIGQARVIRVPVQWTLGNYKISFGMMTYLRQYNILHSHLYRTFQSDCAFFLRRFEKNPMC